MRNILMIPQRSSIFFFSFRWGCDLSQGTPHALEGGVAAGSLNFVTQAGRSAARGPVVVADVTRRPADRGRRGWPRTHRPTRATRATRGPRATPPPARGPKVRVAPVRVECGSRGHRRGRDRPRRPRPNSGQAACDDAHLTSCQVQGKLCPKSTQWQLNNENSLDPCSREIQGALSRNRRCINRLIQLVTHF